MILLATAQAVACNWIVSFVLYHLAMDLAAWLHIELSMNEANIVIYSWHMYKHALYL